jgi:lipoate-protein ligase A
MKHTWRLIVDGPMSGARNMAKDEALLKAVQQGLASVTVRFYRWAPATVSLGYFQAAEDVDREAIGRLGLGLVRRPTGGRAILHDDELTYSIVAPGEAIPGGRNIGRSYLSISEALMRGLEILGIEASVGDEKATRDNSPAACFALSTRADLTARGQKVIGSAQMRREGFILQHGSIPVALDLGKHAAVFGAVSGAEKAAEQLAAKASGVAGLIGRRPSWEEMERAFALGFAEVFHARMEAGEMTAAEEAEAEKLEAEKYGTEEFTVRAPNR